MGEQLIVVNPRNPLSIERSRISAARVNKPASTEEGHDRVLRQAISNVALGGIGLGLVSVLITAWATNDNQTAERIAFGSSFASVAALNIAWPPSAGLATLYSTPAPPLRGGESVTMVPQTLEDYVGAYEDEHGLKLWFSVVEGRLAVSRFPHLGSTSLARLSRDEFGSRGRRLGFSFARDASGAVNGVTVEEVGRWWRRGCATGSVSPLETIRGGLVGRAAGSRE